jgi:hypothetical protein
MHRVIKMNSSFRASGLPIAPFVLFQLCINCLPRYLPPPHHIRVIKSRRIGWPEHVARVGERTGDTGV